jgi:hypothetical protein
VDTVVPATPSQLPQAGWHPFSSEQNSSPTPQYPNTEQQDPQRVPAHVTPLPQVPSVLSPVRVGVTETVVLVVVRDVDAVLDGTTDPLGPARYQLEDGSPRHSPTVTA